MSDPFDLVRRLYAAVNRADLEGIVECYDERCDIEGVVPPGEGHGRGRAHVREAYARWLAGGRGALDGLYYQVRRVAGIETGWGWVRADWIAGWQALDGDVQRMAGYSDFLVEDALIRRHRTVASPLNTRETAAPPARPDQRRDYPARPIVGVGAVTFVDGRVVLIKRRYEPLAGQWSLPGGTLELGETLEAGVAREMREETGLLVEVGPVVEVFDRILLDERQQVRYHFVLIDYLCRARGGTLAAGSDVSDVALADPAQLASFDLTPKASAVIAQARRVAAEAR